MSRRRGRKGLQVDRGERYALLLREVAESAAYNALPDWARTVLIALLLQYKGSNNGCLALPYSQARELGVSAQWKLYAGLRVLTEAGLIVCTRQGRLEGGTKIPSMYAVTWREINDPRDGVTYDAGYGPCPLPSNVWARWVKPEPKIWRNFCRQIASKNHGRKKNPVSTTVGKGRSTTVGAMRRKTAQPRWVKETTILAPPVVDTSKTSGVGAGTVRGDGT